MDRLENHSVGEMGTQSLAPGTAPLHMKAGHAVPVRWPRATGPPSLPATPHVQFSLHPHGPSPGGRAPQALSAAPCPTPWAPQMALPPVGSWWCLLGALRPASLGRSSSRRSPEPGGAQAARLATRAVLGPKDGRRLLGLRRLWGLGGAHTRWGWCAQAAGLRGCARAVRPRGRAGQARAEPSPTSLSPPQAPVWPLPVGLGLGPRARALPPVVGRGRPARAGQDAGLGPAVPAVPARRGRVPRQLAERAALPGQAGSVHRAQVLRGGSQLRPGPRGLLRRAR